MSNYKIAYDPYTKEPAVVFCDGIGFIPFAEENSDYQKYLSWLAEGNTPEPWNPEQENN